MATRLYVDNYPIPYTPATIRGAWDETGTPVTGKLNQSPAGAATDVTKSETTSTNNWDVLFGRWVSDPLAASTTISGTIDYMLMVWESSSANAHLHFHIYVTTGDSDTPRGTLLTDHVNPTEMKTVQRGQGESGVALSSVSAQAGDRIVVEVGAQFQNTHTFNFDTEIHYGGTGTPDLVEDETDTTAPKWIEFSSDFALTPAILGATTAGGELDDPEVVIDVPSGTRDDDLLILTASHDLGSSDNFTFSVDASFTPLLAHTRSSPSGEGVNMQVWYKIASSEPASYTVTSSNAEPLISVSMIRAAGHDSTTPFNVSTIVGYNDGTEAKVPSVTTTVDACRVLGLVAWDQSKTLNAIPAGWTQIFHHQPASHDQHGIQKSQPTAGATGVAQFDLSSASPHVGAVIAIQPLQGGTNVTVTPAAQALTAAQPAASVVTQRSQTIQPATQTITTSAPPATVAVQKQPAIAPAAQSLALSQPAPIVQTKVSPAVQPTAQATSLTQPTPTVSTQRQPTVTPATQSIQAALSVPSISTQRQPTITPQAQTVSAQPPSATVVTIKNAQVGANPLFATSTAPSPSVATQKQESINVGTQQATTSQPASTVSSQQQPEVTPDAQAASVSAPSPTVSTAGETTVQPGVHQGTVNQPQATVVTQKQPTVSVGTQQISTSQPTPSVSAEGSVQVNMAAQTVSASQSPATVTTNRATHVQAGTQTVASSTPPPAVATSIGQTENVDAQAATLTTPAVTIQTDRSTTVQPGVAEAVLEQPDPLTTTQAPGGPLYTRRPALATARGSLAQRRATLATPRGALYQKRAPLTT